MTGFPASTPGVRYLTEGGQETELMYKHGHELPEFAMYPLLDNAAAVADLTDMYTRYLEVAATYDFVPLMGGFDYRASPDWAAKLGISKDGLVEYQHRAISFLRDVAKPFADRIPKVLYVGVVGPRGDAYDEDNAITAAEAEDYHATQLGTLRDCGVDLVSAMTVNNVPEAVGLARAAHTIGLPLSVSFMVDPAGRILTGRPLQHAIEAVDAEAGDARPDFYGINCSHPTEFAPSLTTGPWLERVRMLRPNSSTTDKQSLCTIGHLESGDPDALGGEIAELVQRYPHIDIVGGCCGTWTDHLEAAARQIRANEVLQPS
ncbi:MAG: homocysteine S-methyltransferase [Actinomycetota bacterium]|jgi:S-methylmethionine-dependent homocysteine/selenocysteine methylase|nr:homocysteine S-methyltransferase [Actinomycetota bacterium]